MSRFYKYRFLKAVMLVGWLMAAEPSGYADAPPPWQIEVRPVYVFYSYQDDDMQGLSLGVIGGYRFYDTLILKLDVDYTALETTALGKAQLFEPSVGLNYDIDWLPVMPAIGFGLGPLVRDEKGKDRTTDFSWHLLINFHYLVTKTFGVGAEAKYHFIITDAIDTRLYLTLGAKLLFFL